MPIKAITPKIAIAGAGLTGVYLFRLLRKAGYQADIYDVESQTRCGLSPCAWGTSKGFIELIAEAGLAADNYILKCFDHVLMDEVKIKADLMTIDKPRVVEDLLAGARIKYSCLQLKDYDRIIDATGVSRAFLPVIADDLVMECVQYHLTSSQTLENKINIGRVGYAWCFPLFTNRYHIGCGSLVSDGRTRMGELGWWSNPSGSPQKVICECSGKIRLTGPQAALPFVVNDIWGVGEAIGCVAPLAGDGIVPGMKSVQLLMRHWNDPDGFSRAVLKEFEWMQSERKVLDKLRQGKPLGVRDALVLKRNSKRMGMQIKISSAAKLLRRMQ